MGSEIIDADRKRDHGQVCRWPEFLFWAPRAQQRRATRRDGNSSRKTMSLMERTWKLLMTCPVVIGLLAGHLAAQTPRGQGASAASPAGASRAARLPRLCYR